MIALAKTKLSPRRGQTARQINAFVTLSLDDIDVTPAKEARAGHKTSTINEYKRNYSTLDKGTVVCCTDSDSGKPWKLVDGYARYLAARKSKIVEDEFVDGGADSFINIMDRAIKANQKHGVKYTREDYLKQYNDVKRRHPDWAQATICKFIGKDPSNFNKIINGWHKREEIKSQDHKRAERVSEGVKMMRRSMTAVITRWDETIKIKRPDRWSNEQRARVIELYNQLKERMEPIL